MTPHKVEVKDLAGKYVGHYQGRQCTSHESPREAATMVAAKVVGKPPTEFVVQGLIPKGKHSSTVMVHLVEL